MPVVFVGKKEAKTQVATHLLQFVFLSDSGFRFPLAHFPTNTCPASLLYMQFWEGVLQMRKAGFRYNIYQHCITELINCCAYGIDRLHIYYSYHMISLCIKFDFNSTILFSIYYVICDGGDSNRQFIKIHFSSFSPVDMHFVSYNMLTEDPMIFLMDCKVF